MNATTPLALLEPAPVSLRSSGGLGWNGFATTLLGVHTSACRVPVTTQRWINVHVGPPVQMDYVYGGCRYSRIQAHGDTDVIPAGVPGMWTDDADCRILRIVISSKFVRSIAGQIGMRAGITPRLQWRDARVRHPAAALGTELQAEGTSDALYTEGLRTALAVRLLSSSRDGVAGVADRIGTLTPRVATRMISYIETHLRARLTLAELAAQTGSGVPHFNVLFRATLGVPAHHYVVQRRVAHTKALLLKSRRNASQITLDVGFAHQSHVTQWVQRLLGITPRSAIRAGKVLAATADTPAGQSVHRICQVPLFLQAWFVGPL